MDILFASQRLRKEYNDQRSLVRRYGSAGARKLRQRLDDLRAASVLDDMRNLPGRCHELVGDRAGQFSLDLMHPNRLLFEPADDPLPRLADGKSLDWTRVTAVRILGVEDTHE